MAVSKDNPLALCRTFLFIPGADEGAMLGALDGDGDVLVQELEDFTPPARRAGDVCQPAARLPDGGFRTENRIRSGTDAHKR